MEKDLIRLEYPFGKISESMLWGMIGDPLGLALWFSEEITVHDDIFTFIWDRAEHEAVVLEIVENKLIKFQWIEDKDSEFYFQFEMIMDELGGEYTFVVSDFVQNDEKSDAILLWNKQVNDLKKKCGIQIKTHKLNNII